MPGTDGQFSLKQGIASAKAGNMLLARMHLQQAVTLEPENASIWLWLAWVAESPARARQCLEWILQRQPDHALARVGLDWARALDTFDPHTPAPVPQETAPGGQPVLISAPPPSQEPELSQQTEPEPVEQSGAPEVAEPEPEAEFPPRGERLTYERDQTVSHGYWNHPPDLMPPLYVPPGHPTETPAIEAGPHPAVLPSCELVGRETPVSLLEPLSAGPVPGPRPADQRPLVLVVDDSPTIRKLVAMTLDDQVYRVVEAADGVEAIDLMAGERPALILLDIHMPRLDGYKLCKLVRKNDVTRKIPVVMLSDKDGTFDKLRGRLVGCTDYVTKPFEPGTLKRVVEKYAGQPAS